MLNQYVSRLLQRLVPVTPSWRRRRRLVRAMVALVDTLEMRCLLSGLPATTSGLMSQTLLPADFPTSGQMQSGQSTSSLHQYSATSSSIPAQSQQSAGLTITPTFDSSITSDGNAAVIEATINDVIAEYEAEFTDKITVKITFAEMTTGLGQSNFFEVSVPYAQFRNALASSQSTTADTQAMAYLPASSFDPVQGQSYINAKPANLRALGIPYSPMPFDGKISLNTSICNLDRNTIAGNKYDLASVTAHEIDEVLGLGSNLDHVPRYSSVLPEDLFRYGASGQRSYTTTIGANAYFSLDGGFTDLVHFNQQATGDHGDWFSSPSPFPQVQDAFNTPGVVLDPKMEYVALDVIGYHPIGVAAPVGVEQQVNTTTVKGQFYPSVATDKFGNYVVTWVSDQQDGSGFGVFAQRYTASHRPLGGEFQVNTYTTNNQSIPRVAMDDTGAFVIVWQSNFQNSGRYDLYGQRYSNAGVPQGGEFQINTYETLTQLNASIAMDGAGEFVVTWASLDQAGAGKGPGGTDIATGYDIYAQRFDASGGKVGGEFLVNTYTTGDQIHPTVAMDATGDFTITWSDYYQSGIYAQMYKAGGGASGSNFQVNFDAMTTQTGTFITRWFPQIAMDAGGDFVITWSAYGPGDDKYGIYAQVYKADSSLVGSEFLVNTYTTGNQAWQSVGMDDAGDFVVAWGSDGQDGDNYGDFAQLFKSDGTKIGKEFQVNTFTANGQRAPYSTAVAMDASGKLEVVWQSNTQDGDQYGVYNQAYFADVGHVEAPNDGPSGTSNTVVTLQNHAYTFNAMDFGFYQIDQSLKAVVISTLPGAGSLTDNGAAVVAGDFVSVNDINAGKLIFTPATNATGAPYAQFLFAVQDDGGTAGGRHDVDPDPKTMSIFVTNVNDAPIGTAKTVTALEDNAYHFMIADFGFTDPNDNPVNHLQSVLITTLPAAGTLKDNGFAVVAGQFIGAVDIDSGDLTFTPALNKNGTNYASFTFQVKDDGGGANHGLDLDLAPKKMTINVTPVNDAPVGAAKTVSMVENTTYTFAATDFLLTDPNDVPANTLLAVKITTLPGLGSLTDNSLAVTAGTKIPVADITGGKLKYTPVTNGIGATYSSFTFQVQDNGGTAIGGIDLDPTARKLTFAVTSASAHHAPLGTAKTITVVENTAYVVKAGDFGFTDLNDSPADTLKAVKFTLLPTVGTLKDNGVAVTVNQSVTAADINGSKLVFTPNSNTTGGPFFLCKFQVQDTGGTAGGGSDLDPTAKVMNVKIITPNHAPTGASKTVSTLQNTAYTLKTADFGFSDASDNPANALKAAKITVLPTVGTLKDNGTAVTANQFISAADIAGGKLVFTPNTNLFGGPFFLFKFQVQDDGGTVGGGVDLDPTARVMDIIVGRVNHAPAGTSKTIASFEDAAYVVKTTDFGFTDPNDNPANTLLAVKFTSMPTVGVLKDNGVAVTAGQTVNVGDISGGKLIFTSNSNLNGGPYFLAKFQVEDNGGTAGGGSDLDPTAKVLSISLTAVNDPPVGTSKTITSAKNANYVLKTTDFGFTDPNDSPANSLLAVKFPTLPTVGTFKDNGVALTAGQTVTVAEISAGKLIFTPNNNVTGGPYFLAKFQVQDNGGTANGGVNLDPTAKVLSIQLVVINAAPTGTAKTVSTLKNTAYTFAAADFGFSDPNNSPANTLLAVKITTLPTVGSLTDNGAAVTAGAYIPVADITSGKLKFTPVSNATGSPYSSFTFQVQDNGGTALGGVDTDPTARKMTINVTVPANSAPVGKANTVATAKNKPYVFAAADFGFSDPNDSPVNALLAVKITTLPAKGSLTDNGAAVTAGAHVPVADITGGKLKFTPALNGSGSPYTSFTFQVQDNGGTANGGVDTDPTARAMTINIPTGPVGPETRVNTYTTGLQFGPRIGRDAAGDYVVAWTGYNQYGSQGDIFAQRYNANGVPVGSEFRVNSYTTGNQRDVSVGMDDNGNFVIAWNSLGQDGDGNGIYAKRYSSSGAVLQSDFRVNTFTTRDQSFPSVAVQHTGAFVIAWASVTQDGDSSGIYAQRYSAAGAVVGSEFQVNTYTTNRQQFPSVAIDTAGDFVVAWQSRGEDDNGGNYGSYGIYAQRFNSAGTKQGGEFRVNTYTTGTQDRAQVAMDSAGNFVVTWESQGNDGDSYGIFAKRYNAAGVVQGSDFKVNTYTTSFQSQPAIAMDSTGDFVITWSSFQQDGGYDGIYAQRYSPAAVAQGTEFRVNTYTTESQNTPSIAMDGSGNYVIAWVSTDQDGSSEGIYSQRFNS